MEGFEDPFNRRTFPWGGEDRALTAWFAALGKLRGKSAPLRRGELRWLTCRGSVLSFARDWEGETVSIYVNAGFESAAVSLPDGSEKRLPPLSGRMVDAGGKVLLKT